MANESELHQIGAVATRVGLSLRTIRHYDELGIVTPTGHSPGGFRLYTDRDIDRLLYIKAMKPLKFTLEETAQLLAIHDALEAGEALDAEAQAFFADAVDRAQARCVQLETQLGEAQALTATMGRELGVANGRKRSSTRAKSKV